MTFSNHVTDTLWGREWNRHWTVAAMLTRTLEISAHFCLHFSSSEGLLKKPSVDDTKVNMMNIFVKVVKIVKETYD